MNKLVEKVIENEEYPLASSIVFANGDMLIINLYFFQKQIYCNYSPPPALIVKSWNLFIEFHYCKNFPEYLEQNKPLKGNILNLENIFQTNKNIFYLMIQCTRY
jgi:hypothetical protein